MKKALLAIILMAGIVSAQVSYFTPEKPIANDTITITYDPYAPHSRFSINDEVYALITIIAGDGKSYHEHHNMTRGKSVFTHKYKVENNISYLSIYFITLSNNSFQLPALEIIIYTPDGIPCRNAMYPMMSSENYLDYFRKEISNYPDNFLIYRKKWFYDKHEKPDEFESILTREMEILKKNPSNSIGKLYSLAYGYNLLGDFDNAFSIISEMMRIEYPEYKRTLEALNSIYYKISTEEKNEEVENKLKKIANQIANTKEVKFTSSSLSSLYNLLSDSAKITHCKRWIETDQYAPEPYYSLAYLYNQLSINPNEAESLTRSYIDKLLKGHLRFTGDVSGKRTTRYLPVAYRLLAEISLKLGKHADALMAVKASQQLGLLRVEKAYDLEGEIWFELKDYKSARDAWLEAWKEGDLSAKENILACYRKMWNSDAKFEEYFKKITASEKSISDKKSEEKNKQEPAPPFEITTLEGKKYSSESLKGKVVVLNFWGMGCGPCRAEFPQLNNLVDEYKSKDVVFLGLTFDEDKNLLEKFFKKFTFNFEIAPNAGKIFTDYDVLALPVSFVIDKKGNILKRFGGAEPDIDKKIKIFIDRVL